MSCAATDFQFGQLFGLALGLQGSDHVVQFAVHDERQLVEREVDAVVCQATLREVVGPDAVAAVAAADQATPLVYRQEWTGRIFREMALIIRVMCQDTHAELRAAWSAIQSADGERKTRALAAMQELSAISYETTTGAIRERMNARNRVDEARLARELADFFRGNYQRAEAIARGGGL